MLKVDNKDTRARAMTNFSFSTGVDHTHPLRCIVMGLS